MSELIRREDVQREIQARFDGGAFRWQDGQDLMDRINALPSATIDAVEVRHGYNVKDDSPSLFECSICGWEDYDTYTGDTDTYNYCPNCGARMDGKEIQK